MELQSMNLEKIFALQAALDNRIIHEHSLEGEDLIENTTLALIVEIGELANTTRCFKHWSTKGISEDAIVLDEAADCIHFFVSLAIKLGITPEQLGKRQEIYLDKSLSNGFMQLYNRLSQLSIRPHRVKQGELISAYHHFLSLVNEFIGFSEQELEAAYYLKNSVNHERQNSGTY